MLHLPLSPSWITFSLHFYPHFHPLPVRHLRHVQDSFHLRSHSLTLHPVWFLCLPTYTPTSCSLVIAIFIYMFFPLFFLVYFDILLLLLLLLFFLLLVLLFYVILFLLLFLFLLLLLLLLSLQRFPCILFPFSPSLQISVSSHLFFFFILSYFPSFYLGCE